MNKRHKLYDVIVAWAEGKEIQVKYAMSSDWEDWDSHICPSFVGVTEYRIKPEPKPDVVEEFYIKKSFKSWITSSISSIFIPNLFIPVSTF